MNDVRRFHGRAIHAPCSSALTLAFAAAVLLCGTLCSAAPQTQSSQPPPATEKQSNSNKPASAASTTASPKPASKSKVITNDDIDARRAQSERLSPQPAATQLYGSLGDCDADCESEVRGELGFTEDREGEWQLQLAVVRREIAADSDWHSMLRQSAQYVHLYCPLQRQQQLAASPSGNDYRSRVERAENEENFESYDRVMRSRVDEWRGRLNHRIDEVSSGEPVRAAVMRFIADRAINNCPPPVHH